METQLSCLDSEPDDAFGQQTYFGYDNAGRIVKETIEDDGGRSAPQSYEWDKNSNPMAVIAPSGTKMQWDYNYGSYNSDRDKIIRVRRNDGANTYITTAGYWNPFGPMKSYRQYSKVSGSYVRAHFTWDDGYRPTDVQYKTDAGYNLMRTAIGWDGDGNLASRNYTDAYSGVTDDYFTYDYLDQVTRNSMSTSTSSSQVKSRPYYNTSGDRYYLHHDGGWGDEYYSTYYTSGTDKINYVYYYDGGLRYIYYGHDGRGNRLYDDDTHWSVDRRDYSYDARNNLVAVSGTYAALGTYGYVAHDYTQTNAYDHKNRRIFKSFYDEVSGDEAQWFFYYDLSDRLIEVKHVPDVTDSSKYSLYQFYWIGARPIAYWQVDYPKLATTKRYFHSDDQHRPVEVYGWNSTTSPLHWAINPDLFGWDKQVYGSIFQPLSFPGQYRDVETRALASISSYYTTVARPGLHDNRFRTYDPFTGTYLQVDPKVDDTWDAYRYVRQNPVMWVDPTGLAGEGGPTTLGDALGLLWGILGDGGCDPTKYDCGLSPDGPPGFIGGGIDDWGECYEWWCGHGGGGGGGGGGGDDDDDDDDGGGSWVDHLPVVEATPEVINWSGNAGPLIVQGVKMRPSRCWDSYFRDAGQCIATGQCTSGYTDYNDDGAVVIVLVGSFSCESCKQNVNNKYRSCMGIPQRGL